MREVMQRVPLRVRRVSDRRLSATARWIRGALGVLGLVLLFVAVHIQRQGGQVDLTLTKQPPTPVPPVASGESRVAILGDVRTRGLDPPPVFGTIVTALDHTQPGLVIGLGDLINADQQPATVNTQWDRFMGVAQPLISTRPFRPCMGNHETNSASEPLAIYQERFALPTNGPTGLEDLAFSFDWGPAHFVCLSTETPGQEHQLGSAQLGWLEQDLATTRQPYVFVYAHDPAYPVGPHIGSSLDVVPQERDQLWSLLKQAAVTAYLAGHEHLYNRQMVAGLPQVIIGTSGSSVYRGFGGAFRGYALLDLGASEAVLRVYDEAGVLRDEAQFPARTQAARVLSPCCTQVRKAPS